NDQLQSEAAGAMLGAAVPEAMVGSGGSDENAGGSGPVTKPPPPPPYHPFSITIGKPSSTVYQGQWFQLWGDLSSDPDEAGGVTVNQIDIEVPQGGIAALQWTSPPGQGQLGSWSCNAYTLARDTATIIARASATPDWATHAYQASPYSLTIDVVNDVKRP